MGRAHGRVTGVGWVGLLLGALFFSFFLVISLSAYSQSSYPAEFVSTLPLELFFASVVLFAAFGLWAWTARDFFIKLAADMAYEKLVEGVDTLVSMRRVWLVAAVAVLVAYHAVFFGIFGRGVVATLDHPMHLYHAYAVADILLPTQSNVWGWTQHFYAGYPVHQFYPPLVSVLVAAAAGATGGLLSIAGAYRLVLLIVITLVPVSMYVFCGEAGLSRRQQTLVTLLSVMPSSRFAEMLFWGTTPMLLALGLAPLVFACLFRFLQTKSWQSFVALVFVEALVLLSHPVIHVGVLAGIVVMLVGVKLSVGEKLGAIFGAVALPVAVTAWWSLPALAGVLGSELHVHDTGVTFHSYSTLIGLVNWQVNLLASLPLAAWPLLGWSYLRWARNRGAFNHMWRFLYAYPLILYVVAFVGGGIPPLWRFELLHLIPLISLFLLVPLGRTLEEGLGRRGLAGMAAIFVLATMLASPVAGTFIFVETQAAAQQSATVLRASPPQNVSAVYDWLASHADGHSRIVLEDVEHPFFVKKPWGLGATPALAPMLAGEELRFIARTQAFPVFRGADNLTVVEGVFFGTPIEEISHAQMKDALRRFNVEYLVLWHEPSKEFFEEHPQATLDEVIDGFAIYRVPPHPDGYIAEKGTECPARISRLGHDRVIIENVSSTCDMITVSMAYHPGWRARRVDAAISTSSKGMLLHLPDIPNTGSDASDEPIILEFRPMLFG